MATATKSTQSKPAAKAAPAPAAKTAEAKATSAEKALATRPANAVATANFDAEAAFAADAGQGMEGADADSFAIPFLSCLQSNSPQVDEASGEALEGARAGMFFENVTGKLTSGKTGVLIVPCAFKRVFLRWGPRGGANAGFKGELSPAEVAQLRADGKLVEAEMRLYFPEKDGTINPKTCDRVADTRSHYILIIDEETGTWTPALFPLGSTQIKKSKTLLAALASVKVKGPQGLYTPPTFSNLVRVTSVAESNDKGNWFGVRPVIEGRVDRAEVYAAAKAFRDQIAKGQVEVRYENATPTGEEGAPGAF